MGGGLMQLVAYGAQDIYLTGNPQITFFKVVYRRHTNFSMESIQQTLDGAVGPCKKVSCTISRNGDLIHKMYLRIHHSASNCACGASGIPTSSEGYMTKSPIPMIPDTLSAGAVQDDISVCANDLINSVEIEIGGQKIDKHYGDWLNIWTQLSTSASKNVGLEELLNLKKGKYSYVPLQFWFCRNPGLALPLIALQYHEVKLKIEFNKSKSGGSCTGAMCELTPDSGDWNTASLWVDYIYLDTDERRRFAQVSHEYLIEQLQFTGTETLESGSSSNVRLNFNHPVKELIWRATGMVSGADTDKRVDPTNNPIVGYSDRNARLLEITYDGAAASSTWNVGDSVMIFPASNIGGTAFVPAANSISGALIFGSVQKFTKPTVTDSDKVWIEVTGAGTSFRGVEVTVGAELLEGGGALGMAELDNGFICVNGSATKTALVAGTPTMAFDRISTPIYQHPQSATSVSGGTDASADAAGGSASVCAAASWSDVTLQLNGHERFAERHSEYFRLVQPLQHHTSIPADSGIHVYSFALKPEEHQPSGTCNFSRIDSAVLKLAGMTTLNGALAEDGQTKMSGATLRVYAVNYNVLRIMSGMGGLAYSN